MIDIQNTVKWETNGLAGGTSFQIGFTACLIIAKLFEIIYRRNSNFQFSKLIVTILKIIQQIIFSYG